MLNPIYIAIYHAIACGLLTSLTWIGLVWMSKERPIASGRGWVQGVGIVAINNTFLWIVLASLNLRLMLFWAVSFLFVNMAIAHLLFPLCDQIRIPRIWGLLIHPMAIATIGVLFSGAIGLL